MATLQNKRRASIVTIGLPWNDDRVSQMGFDPLKVKEGIAMVDKLMEERGFTAAGYTAVQASDRTGLDEFKKALKAQRRDALFLGGGLREGGPLQVFREQAIATAKEIQPNIKVVQVSLQNGPQSIVEAAEEVEGNLD